MNQVVMRITVQEFLRKKGAIGLLSLLHERPKTYSEIKPEIGVVSDTIITRRDEAAELGLLNISLGDANVGTKKVYHLTPMGEFLTDQMAREGLVSSYRKMRTLEQLVDEQTDTVVQWVDENPSQLLQFEEADGTIIQTSSQADASTTGEGEAETNEKQDETTDTEPEGVVKIEGKSTTDAATDTNQEDPSNDDSETDSENSEDKTQTRLSDSDLQDKMEEGHPDPESENDDGTE